jgi:hypothetical protein
MSRKGGNPDLKQHQFECKHGDQPMLEAISIRLPNGTRQQLIDKFGKGYQQKIREAIADLLSEKE